MRQVSLGRGSLHVSEIALGTSQFGYSCDEATASRIVDAYLGAGGTFIDTADVYAHGETESMLGRMLKGRRSSVIVATKVGSAMGPRLEDRGLSRTHILAAVDASLTRLGTDYIDLYQLHRWDVGTPIEELLEALGECVKLGKVREIGCSNFTGWQLGYSVASAAARNVPAMTAFQPEYSLIQRGSERELFPACREFGMGCAVWSPLGSGLLTGKYAMDAPPPVDTRGEMAAKGEAVASAWNAKVSERSFAIAAEVTSIADELGKSPAQVALRWVMDSPDVAAPIIGARRLEQLHDNLGAAGWSLPGELKARLDDVSAIDPGYPYFSPSAYK